MTKAILDANIWDRLAVDERARERIGCLCDAGELEIVVPNTLLRELKDGPFGGVPVWFPTTLIDDSVFVLDYSLLDCARLGNGKVFTAHRGASKQIADAVIVDAVDTDADIFVSEDRRARERYANLRDRSRSLNYERFCKEVLGL